MSENKEDEKIEKEPLNVNAVLFESRQVFLDEVVTTKLTSKITKQLMVLDNINNDAITMWINSPGGSCIDGLAIIETMKMIKSPIVTIINGEACSMASIISICGDKRYAFKTSIYMAHPMSAWTSDYLPYMKDRMVFLDKLDKIISAIYKKNTKLTKADLTKLANGELWFFGKELFDKGLVDGIIK